MYWPQTWPFGLIASLGSLNYKHTNVLAQQRWGRSRQTIYQIENWGVKGEKFPITMFTWWECCAKEKVGHIKRYLYPEWQKLSRPRTASSYVTTYMKSFILRKQIPFKSYNLSVFLMFSDSLFRNEGAGAGKDLSPFFSATGKMAVVERLLEWFRKQRWQRQRSGTKKLLWEIQ